MNKYRRDLDGIRAIAVLLVLFFHVDFSFFKAGFIGVDIFFTISGFLISGIVLREAQSSGFSFKKFYIRRATRLLPAYLFMLTVTLFVSIYVLAPLALFDFFKSALASSLFVSNFYFLLNHSGYFSTSVHELPLLHTWSLSVEEQFYLIMPTALILWLKVKNTSIRIAILLISLILSIVVSGVLTSFNQGLSYFLVPSRIHEFLFGTLLAVIINTYGKLVTPSKFVSNVLALCSLFGIVLISITLSSKGEFPGYIAAAVCLFTALLIYSGLNERCISHKLLGNSLFVWVGLLSYSIYLWHWPIVSFLKYVKIDFDWHIQLLVIFFSFLLAVISYFYVEKPFRYGRYSKNGHVAFSLYVLPALLLCGFVTFHSIIPSSFSDKAVEVELMTKATPEQGRELCHSNEFTDSEHCYLGVEQLQNSNSLLWGDSHASHFAPFVDYYSKTNNLKTKDATMGNCPALLNASLYLRNVGSSCLQKNKLIVEYIKHNQPENLFIASSWYGYFSGNSIRNDHKNPEQLLVLGVVETLNEMHRLGVKNVYFFTTVARPSMDMSHCYLKRLRYTEQDCNFTMNPEQNQLASELNDSLSKLSFVTVIDVNSLICTEGVCATVLNDIPLYRDGNHLNRFGSQELARRYLEHL